MTVDTTEHTNESVKEDSMKTINLSSPSEPINEPETSSKALSSELKKDDIEAVESKSKADNESEPMLAAASASSRDETLQRILPPLTSLTDIQAKTRYAIKGFDQVHEAFPSIHKEIILAVLIASNGKLENAFKALLALSDPDILPESLIDMASQNDAPPKMPSRPKGKSQEELDADYARQLQMKYDEAHQRRVFQQQQKRQQQQVLYNNESAEDNSWIDEELPKIKEKLAQGFNQTQTKVKTFFNKVKQQIEGVSDEDDELYSDSNQPNNLRFQTKAKSSLPASKNTLFDADPTLLDDDFAELNLKGSVPMMQSEPYSDKARKNWVPLSSQAKNPKDSFHLDESSDDDDNNNNREKKKIEIQPASDS